MRLIRSCWRWSLVVTLPVAAITVLFCTNVYQRWHTFRLRALTSEPYSLRAVGTLEADHLKREFAAASAGMGLAGDLEASGLQSLHLIVPKSNLAQLFARLPQSGREYVDGGLFRDSEGLRGSGARPRLQPVKVRLRGDSNYHWGYWKKSWRIKTDREELFEGMRKFNLVAPRTPEQYNNHFGHRLATYLDLLAPRSEIVAMTLNQDFGGLYQLTEQIEESTIRRAGRMPGDVYSGDIGGRVSYAEIYEIELFQHPGTWEKVAVNNHFDEASIAPLEALLDLVASPSTEETHGALADLVDMGAFARFSAFEALAGTVHNDITHNWRLYYDPWVTRFVPIVWDPVAWHTSWRTAPGARLRSDVISSPLHAALFHNGDFLRERERAFGEFFGAHQDTAFLDEVGEVIDAADQVIDHDPHMVVAMSILEPAEVRAAWAELRRWIRGLFDGLREEHLGGFGSRVEVVPLERETAGVQQLWVRVSGRRQLDSLELTLDGPLGETPGLTAQWMGEGQLQSSALDGAVRAAGHRLELQLGLLPKTVVVAPSLGVSASPGNHLSFEPGTYLLTLPGLPGGSRLMAASASFTDGAPFPVLLSQAVPEAPALVDMGPMRRLVPEVPLKVPTIWSGDMELAGTVEVTDLVLEPGTRVRCHPGANLLVRGRIVAQGSVQEPIRFEPHAPDQEPWGVVALKGEGASGSILEHCHFEGGSGWKEPLFEYSAMVSIHGAEGVIVRHTTFSRSQRVDDMVHGVYSEIVFENCRFIGSLFDALDMDISRVTITDCVFEDSGNDAVDLMTSSARIEGTLFRGSEDKGVSVGEGSSLFLVESTVEGSGIGVQVKDDSLALLSNVDLIGNGVAIDAYKKNWRYSGGGSVRVSHCWLEGNQAAFGADSHSRLWVRDSFVDEAPLESGGVTLDLGDGMTFGPALEAHRGIEGSPVIRAPEEWSMSGAWYRPFFERANPQRRGRSSPVK